MADDFVFSFRNNLQTCALATDMKSQEVTAEKRAEAFDKMWNYWIRGRAMDTETEKTDEEIHDAINDADYSYQSYKGDTMECVQ